MAAYLNSGRTGDLVRWEQSDVKRWKFIQAWARAPGRRVKLEQLLRIICNNGGNEAEMLLCLERSNVWELATGGSSNKAVNQCVQSLRIDATTAQAVLYMASVAI